MYTTIADIGAVVAAGTGAAFAAGVRGLMAYTGLIPRR
jgi:hypothetical protein